MGMMWRDVRVLLIVSLVLTAVTEGAGLSPPGKPKLTSCRSPEKETFTCWWEPGYDGGLSTTYTLYYHMENSDTVYECPDYWTAGVNSCFFSRNDTSLWVNYNITVVATNALGRNVSDPVEVDVVYIVKPHTPENVTVVVMEDEHGGPYLRVSWEKPRKADTRSGWITLIYQLRAKLEKEEEWEEYDAGQQKAYNVFSPHSGGVYMVQVRCKPDHGFWSEWSSTSYVKVPDYIPRERYVWILFTIFSAFILLILTWMMNVKRNSVKHCLLPPVPGPKIKGFDKQLLKSGKSEEVFNALVMQGFPPTSDYGDLLVEYLEVYDSEEQELVLDGKNLPGGCLKSKSSLDSDSGRGSCNSHTLLMEKCRQEGKEAPDTESQGESSWASMGSPDSQVLRVGTPESAEGRAKTWPTVFSPQHHHASKPPYQSVPEMPTLPVHIPSPTVLQQECKEGLLEEFHLCTPPTAYRCTQAHSNSNINSMERKRDEAALPPSRSMEYVEVQKVNLENVLHLRPLADEGRDPIQLGLAGEDYSKVKGVTSDNVLLLQREMTNQCLSDYCQERGSQVELCTSQQQLQPGKTAMHMPPAMLQDGIHLPSNGYVDTTSMMATY